MSNETSNFATKQRKFPEMQKAIWIAQMQILPQKLAPKQRKLRHNLILDKTAKITNKTIKNLWITGESHIICFFAPNNIM